MKRMALIAFLAAVMCVMVRVTGVDSECLAARDQDQWTLAEADSIGMELLRKGDYDGAIRIFKENLNKDKKAWGSYTGLIAVYCYTGKPDEMMSVSKAFQKAAADDRVKSWASLYDATANYVLGNKAKSERSIKRVEQYANRTKDPDFMIAMHRLCSMYCRDCGEIKKAVEFEEKREAITETKRIDESKKIQIKGSVLWNKAYDAILAGDLKTAKQLEQEFLSLKLDDNPACAQNYKKLKAAIAYGEGRYQDVIEIYKDNYGLFSYVRQAMAYEKLGNKEKAKELWKKVLDRNDRSYNGIMWHHNAKKILAEL